MENQTDEKNRPVAKFGAGTITATHWNNKTEKDGREINFTTVKLERSYKDKEDEWQSTSSLREDDLPKAILVLQKSYEHLKLRAQD